MEPSPTIPPSKDLVSLITMLLTSCKAINNERGNPIFSGKRGNFAKEQVANSLARSYRIDLSTFMSGKGRSKSFYITQAKWLLLVFSGKAPYQRIVDQEKYNLMIVHWQKNYRIEIDRVKSLLFKYIETLSENGGVIDKKLYLNEYRNAVITEHELHVDVISQTQSVFFDKMIINILQDGVDCYDILYQWGGDGEINFDVQEPIGVTTVDYPIGGSLWTRKRILFGRHLSTGDHIALAFTTHAKAKTKPDGPYVSLKIDERYAEDCAVSLSATFGKESRAKCIWFQEQPVDTSAPKWISEMTEVQIGKKYEYPIRISHGDRSCICWSFG